MSRRSRPIEEVYAEKDHGKSRSAKKREATSLQERALELAALSKDRLAALNLPPDLALGVSEFRAAKSHEAKRRAGQYLGRLMRETDVDDLLVKLDAIKDRERADSAAHKRVEALRDALAGGDFAPLETRFPGLEAATRAAIEALVATIKREASGKKPPKASRELFRLLRSLEEGG